MLSGCANPKASQTTLRRESEVLFGPLAVVRPKADPSIPSSERMVIHIAIFGISVGVLLTAELAVKLKELALRLPAALGILSCIGDLARHAISICRRVHWTGRIT